MTEINNENSKKFKGFEAGSTMPKTYPEEIKKSIETKEAEISKENQQELSAQQTSPTANRQISDEKEEKEEIKKDISRIKNLDTARQVKVLVVLAFEKGISYSIKVARSLNDAYLLDELHDKLIGELHDELVKKGKIKEI